MMPHPERAVDTLLAIPTELPGLNHFSVEKFNQHKGLVYLTEISFWTIRI